jgi:hypothetical protein
MIATQIQVALGAGNLIFQMEQVIINSVVLVKNPVQQMNLFPIVLMQYVYITESQQLQMKDQLMKV